MSLLLIVLLIGVLLMSGCALSAIGREWERLHREHHRLSHPRVRRL